MYEWRNSNNNLCTRINLLLHIMCRKVSNSIRHTKFTTNFCVWGMRNNSRTYTLTHIHHEVPSMKSFHVNSFHFSFFYGVIASLLCDCYNNFPWIIIGFGLDFDFPQFTSEIGFRFGAAYTAIHNWICAGTCAVYAEDLLLNPNSSSSST